ncbi:MAG: polysaccharide biosynthesis protein [Planctomycetota bacterium]|jgi:UDP-glucose 4-epimerase
MSYFEGKTVVITGGTGSMGRTLVRRVLTGELGTPKKVIVFSRDETKQHYMRMSYLHKLAATDEVIYQNFMRALEFRIGDVREYASVCAALKDADIVINAAALKQVPTCEYFPLQALMTNCVGAANIVRAIEENGYAVDSVVAISTDKACKPINVMGMTKSVQERILIAANVLNPRTRFICARYGNVLASRGSVVPLFHDQIRKGGPLTVTVPAMTRFLLSLDQAVDTVFAALRHAKRGETYVPNAPSATVINLAKALIGDRDVEIANIGIRPGEKMHEIMVSEEEAHRCVKDGDYYVIRPMLPELRDESSDESDALTKEFSSADVVLSFEHTVDLLKKNKLMIDDVELSQNDEW